MKKSLSLLLALAMVFGLFASMASAASSDLTTEQKYQQLVDNGVLKGTTTGQSQLSDKLTRAQFATIAVAIAGLDVPAATSSAFKDVKVGQWWTNAIQAAYNAGFVNGVGNSLFSPKANVTVQEIVKVAVAIAGLKPVDGATVDGSAAWAGPYIKAAIDAGLPIPTSGYKNAATRGQAIDIAYAVFESLQVKPLNDVKAVLNADDTITVTGVTYGSDSVKVALDSGSEVAAKVAEDGKFTYTTAAQVAGTYTVKVTAYKGTTVLATQTASVTVEGFSVVSATVLNAKQIAVKFNKAVLEGVTAGGHKTLTNYALGVNSTVYPTAADLSSDKTTVTLTFGSGFGVALDTYAQFSVANIKSVSGKTVTSFKQAILLADTAAPAVSGVTYSGGTATVTFSEPLQSEGTVSLNGAVASTSGTVYYTANRNGAAYGNDISSLTFYGLTAATNYSLYIISFKDLAGKVADYNTTLNVPSDTTAPTVTAVTASGNTITVKYSEAVSVAGTVYANGANGLSNGVLADDKLSATFNATSWLNGGLSFSTVTAKVSGYKDLVGNVGADFSTTLTVSTDTVAPVYQSVFYDSTKGYIVVQYNESVPVAPATISYLYTNTSNIQNSSSTSISRATYGYDIDSNGTIDSDELNYVAYNSGTLGAGKYALTLTGFKDGSGNTAATVSPTLTVSASSATGSVVLNSVSYANSQLKFTFNSALTTAALDVSKYLINGQPLPTGTTFVFLGDAKTVVATLPAGSIPVSGERLISVQNIVDENGNTLNTASSSNTQKPVTLKENVKPVAQSITVASDKTITVAFSETLATQAVGTVTGVEVYINGSTTAETGLNFSVANSTLTIASATSKFTATQTIVVKFVSSNIADIAASNTVADSQVSK